MTARPIRYQRQVSDRKGKIFYTSITSLSHISKETGHVGRCRQRRSTDMAQQVVSKCKRGNPCWAIFLQGLGTNPTIVQWKIREAMLQNGKHIRLPAAFMSCQI